VFAAKSMFSPEAQAEFVAARPGTRHVVLPSGSHDAHLDATAEWAAVLHEALTDRTSSLSVLGLWRREVATKRAAGCCRQWRRGAPRPLGVASVLPAWPWAAAHFPRVA
jgi:hypothetical protein